MHEKSRNLIFTIITVMIFLFLLESFSFLILLFHGNIKKETDLAFHPFFKKDKQIWETRFTYDPFLLFRFKPNSVYDKVNINADGFIPNGSSFPDLTRKKEGVTRIFIFGASSVAGSGASGNQTTISARMEQILNSGKPGSYEVINAAVDGYMSFQEMEYFLSDIVRYQPDILIFYDGYTDFYYSVVGGGYINEYQKQHCRANLQEYALYLLTKFDRMVNNSCDLSCIQNRTYFQILAKKIVNHNIDKVPTAAGLDVHDVRDFKNKLNLTPEEAADFYATNVESTIGAATAHGLKILYFLQPTVLNKQSMSEEERKTKEHFVSKAGPFNDKSIERFYARAHEHFVAMAQKHNNQDVLVMDATPIMWQGVADHVYLDEIHTNDLGNSIIAQRMVDLMNKSILLKSVH